MVPRGWQQTRESMRFAENGISGTLRVTKLSRAGDETGTQLDVLEQGMRLIKLEVSGETNWSAEMSVVASIILPALANELHPGFKLAGTDTLNLPSGGKAILSLMRRGSEVIVGIAVPTPRGAVLAEFPLSAGNEKAGMVVAALFSASFRLVQ